MTFYEIPILPSLSTLSKKPMIAMSLSATKAFASSTVASVLAAGPVFFSSQETIVSAVRPGNKDWRGVMAMGWSSKKLQSVLGCTVQGNFRFCKWSTSVVLCILSILEELEGGVASNLELLGYLGLLCGIQLQWRAWTLVSFLTKGKIDKDTFARAIGDPFSAKIPAALAYSGARACGARSHK